MKEKLEMVSKMLSGLGFDNKEKVELVRFLAKEYRLTADDVFPKETSTVTAPEFEDYFDVRRNCGLDYLYQNGKAVGIIVMRSGCSYVVSHKDILSLHNKKADVVKSYAADLGKLKGHSWELLTDDICKEILRQKEAFNSLSLYLGGDSIANKEYLTTSGVTRTPWNVRLMVKWEG